MDRDPPPPPQCFSRRGLGLGRETQLGRWPGTRGCGGGRHLPSWAWAQPGPRGGRLGGPVLRRLPPRGAGVQRLSETRPETQLGTFGPALPAPSAVALPARAGRGQGGARRCLGRWPGTQCPELGPGTRRACELGRADLDPPPPPQCSSRRGLGLGRETQLGRWPGTRGCEGGGHLPSWSQNPAGTRGGRLGGPVLRRLPPCGAGVQRLSETRPETQLGTFGPALPGPSAVARPARGGRGQGGARHGRLRLSLGLAIGAPVS